VRLESAMPKDWRLAPLAAVAAAVLAIVVPMTLKRTPTMAQQDTNTDMAQLATLATLPEGASGVRWSQIRQGAGDGILCALVSFDPARADAILAGAPQTKPDGGLVDISIPQWLIAASGARIETQPNGLQAVRSALHTAAPFARSPFLNGFAWRAAPGAIAFCLAAR
jgi:hypothetical protein